ncbi:Staphylococcal nuclease-like protein putative [Pararhodospirillum photometricum DSM 122]|uniref:Staphylococcal nuclease-like protein putative n=2 Tax=Pararhodospirillum photometricum TaxID=1084 RepID=H6SN88_PARPM|nr:Staphylococcal nuclease-like protein putative [Pararhodospirillum photometricum DSM 122]
MMGPLVRRGVIGIALIFAALAVTPGIKPNLSGPARVIDGNTIVVAGQTLRLYGLDAPDLGQTCRSKENRDWPCGRAAAAALRQYIGEWPVGCLTRTRDAADRLISTCRVGGTDLNAWLVEQGWALACKGCFGGFPLEQGRARLARRGLWSGRFEAPEDWRWTH